MKKGNLLIVDDEVTLLKRLKFNLEEHADQVFTAENGVEALEILAENEIHCIICDINMPKMNGVEVIKRIREQDNEVPFIFYTAHGNQELMMEAVKYGAFDFLDKPSLEGIEEVVCRGLQQGLRKGETAEKSEGTNLSDYKKMLNDIKKV